MLAAFTSFHPITYASVCANAHLTLKHSTLSFNNLYKCFVKKLKQCCVNQTQLQIFALFSKKKAIK